MPRGRPKGSKNKSKSKPVAPPAAVTKPAKRVVLGRGKPQPVAKPAPPVSKPPVAPAHKKPVPEAAKPKRRGRPPGSKNKPKQPVVVETPKPAHTVAPVPVAAPAVVTASQPPTDVWAGDIRIQQKPEHRIPANNIVWTGTTIGQSPSSRFVRVKWDDGSIQFVPAVCIECAVEKKRRRRRESKTDQS